MNLEKQLEIEHKLNEMKNSKSLDGSKTSEKNKVKKKSFWDNIWKKKRLEKTNTVAVLYLRENGNAEPMELQSREGFFEIEGKTYHERKDCIFTMSKERTPLAIIREWSMFPMGKLEWEERDIQTKVSICQDHLIKGVRHAERVRQGEGFGQNKINLKTGILIGLGTIILLAVVLGYK